MSNPEPTVVYDDEPCVENGVHHPYTAYNQGFDAGGMGMSEGRNPYQSGTRERDWWRDGWMDSNENRGRGFPRLAT